MRSISSSNFSSRISLEVSTKARTVVIDVWMGETLGRYVIVLLILNTGELCDDLITGKRLCSVVYAGAY